MESNNLADARRQLAEKHAKELDDLNREAALAAFIPSTISAPERVHGFDPEPWFIYKRPGLRRALALLRDYSEAGLLRPFHIVRDQSTHSAPLDMIEARYKIKPETKREGPYLAKIRLNGGSGFRSAKLEAHGLIPGAKPQPFKLHIDLEWTEELGTRYGGETSIWPHGPGFNVSIVRDNFKRVTRKDYPPTLGEQNRLKYGGGSDDSYNLELDFATLEDLEKLAARPEFQEPERRKEFDYVAAWTELADPAFRALPRHTRALYESEALRAMYEDLPQAQGSLDIIAPPELVARLQEMLCEELAQLAHTVYFFGHWAPRGKSPDSKGATWRLSNLLDVELRKRLGLPARSERDNPRGFSVRCSDGMLRVCYSDRSNWTHREIGPATTTMLEHARAWIAKEQATSPRRHPFEAIDAAPTELAEFLPEWAKPWLRATEEFMR